MRGVRCENAGICVVQTHGDVFPRIDCPQFFKRGSTEAVMLVLTAIDRCQHISSLNIIVHSVRRIGRPRL